MCASDLCTYMLSIQLSPCP